MYAWSPSPHGMHFCRIRNFKYLWLLMAIIMKHWRLSEVEHEEYRFYLVASIDPSWWKRNFHSRLYYSRLLPHMWLVSLRVLMIWEGRWIVLDLSELLLILWAVGARCLRQRARTVAGQSMGSGDVTTMSLNTPPQAPECSDLQSIYILTLILSVLYIA